MSCSLCPASPLSLPGLCTAISNYKVHRAFSHIAPNACCLVQAYAIFEEFLTDYRACSPEMPMQGVSGWHALRTDAGLPVGAIEADMSLHAKDAFGPQQLT